MGKKIVIVGGVAAGATAAAKARRVSEDAEITIIEKSSYISYANCGLPYYIGKVIPHKKDIILHNKKSFGTRFNTNVLLNTKATFIDPVTKKIVVETDKEQQVIEYDKLILATGGKPIIPKIEGIENVDYFFVRSVEDAEKIVKKIESAKNALIVGGGYIGIEMAEALYHADIKTTLVEYEKNILPVFPPECTLKIYDEALKCGIDIRTGTALVKVEKFDDKIKCYFSDQKELIVDFLILATGVTPDTELAETAGVQIGELGGVLVNEKMETSVTDIYAAGDMVEKHNLITGKNVLMPLAGPANKEGRVAGCNAAGGNMTFKGVVGASVVSFNNAVVAHTGLTLKQAVEAGFDADTVYVENAQHAEYYPNPKFIFLKLVYEKKTGKILGATASGEEGVARRIDVISTAIYGNLTVFDLENIDLCYSPPHGSAKDVEHMAGYVAANQVRGEGFGITPEYFLELEKGDWHFQLLDVRTSIEYKMYHLENSINIYVNDLRNNLEKLDKNTPVVVYCAVGFRGYLATKTLRNLGYKAYNVLGGIEAIKRFKKIN
ncbi:FAD-dependent oxidoreductase [Deferribacterales bacterium Es71-Z0220]|uniref:FAD-dependent oxidoreductase n=1 Tax=Deferrivibrio essentukiensis TaxID=2880922 RepID=UPI001F624025|nr:FAD-dependent oxidoreductase [Deferrivibrio essentukiensis]MCB4205333.1 FAD-dependent oxidoreductase [Deferrivibrio essentukiensis]